MASLVPLILAPVVGFDLVRILIRNNLYGAANRTDCGKTGWFNARQQMLALLHTFTGPTPPVLLNTTWHRPPFMSFGTAPTKLSLRVNVNLREALAAVALSHPPHIPDSQPSAVSSVPQGTNPTPSAPPNAIWYRFPFMTEGTAPSQLAVDVYIGLGKTLTATILGEVTHVFNRVLACLHLCLPLPVARCQRGDEEFPA
jgi:hypothetical protein